VSASAWLSEAAHRQLLARKGVRGVAEWRSRPVLCRQKRWPQETSCSTAPLGRYPPDGAVCLSSDGVTYHTGALVAAERDHRIMRSLHRAALGRGLAPTVPATVLAEGCRSGPHTKLSMPLQGCDVENLTEVRPERSALWPLEPRHDDIVDVSLR
jgi:hypothetical protein